LNQRSTFETFSHFYTAFAGRRIIASGELREVARLAQESLHRDPTVPPLIFDARTGEVVEVDLRGSAEQLEQRIAEIEAALPVPEVTMQGEAARRPGRPKLGVVAREVTLLPRHWEWLAGQPGGASVALRKLVEEARRANQRQDRLRSAQEAAYRFLSTMAGNEAGFEEATRELFAGRRERFEEQVENWPIDLRDYAKRLAAKAFEAAE